MKNLKIAFVAVAAIALNLGMASAQDFDRHFCDSTLRLDYIFAGNSRGAQIFLDELCKYPVWAGRRHNLDKLPLQGNGQITITDPSTGDTLYRQSFSTLFQEWQVTEEASRINKSFENCFQVPFPKHPVDIAVTLTDTHRKEVSKFVHRVDPKDILIRQLSDPQIPFRYIGEHGSARERINVAIVAEGYAEGEMDMFYSHCKETVDALLSHEPFKALSDRFNFIAVAAPSKDSGISIPGYGQWKETSVLSHFDTFYMERYLTTLHLKQLHNLLCGIPYEHIIILANTDNYGGGGILNSYTLTASRHPLFRPVVVHEFGHSFGGLADEYYYDDQYEPMYPADTEPWEPNITTLVDFASKWEDMLPSGTVPDNSPYDCTEMLKKIRANKRMRSPNHDLYNKVGIYEGGGYQSKGVWRPVRECRMKINESPVFCPVCRRALERTIRFYTE